MATLTPAASLKRKPDTALTTIEEERVTKGKKPISALAARKRTLQRKLRAATCEWCLPFTESDDPDDLLNRRAHGGECFVKCEDGKGQEIDAASATKTAGGRSAAGR